ncbi:MAG: hypothetical protein EOO30_05755 [Comamonadaceae bacterium]|nr:MAG: hypothetical protein EOO30_05755 [Comamonadaceae bacterium]
MKHSVLTVAALAGALLSAGALAQSKGEADYDEMCRAKPMQGTAAEKAATRQRCIEEAKKAAKTDVPGMADQPGVAGTKTATKAEKAAAREARKATGAQVAKQPKQDPKQPTN